MLLQYDHMIMCVVDFSKEVVYLLSLRCFDTDGWVTGSKVLLQQSSNVLL